VKTVVEVKLAAVPRVGGCIRVDAIRKSPSIEVWQVVSNVGDSRLDVFLIGMRVISPLAQNLSDLRRFWGRRGWSTTIYESALELCDELQLMSCEPPISFNPQAATATEKKESGNEAG
jgi:hypothetical protein